MWERFGFNRTTGAALSAELFELYIRYLQLLNEWIHLLLFASIFGLRGGVATAPYHYAIRSLCYRSLCYLFIMLHVHYAIRSLCYRSLCYSFTMLSFIMLLVHYAIVHYATHSLCYQSLCYTFIMLFVHYAIVHYAIYSKFLLILWEILRHSNRNNFHRNSHFSMRFFNT